MKKLFVLLLFVLAYNTSFSQWWSDGGNLIWPYGNVNITKGDLTLSSGHLRVGPYSKLTYDSLAWYGPAFASQFYVFSNGTDYSMFYLIVNDFGLADGNSSIYASSEDGMEIQSPYLSITSTHSPLQVHDDLIVDSSITSHIQLDNSALKFAASFSLDYPNTYFDMTVYRNDIGTLVDTIIYDNSLNKIIIAFDGNANINLNDYSIMPSRFIALVSTSGGTKAALISCSPTYYAPLGLNAIQCSMYDINAMSTISDFTSGSITVNLTLIPSQDYSIGYQHKENEL